MCDSLGLSFLLGSQLLPELSGSNLVKHELARGPLFAGMFNLWFMGKYAVITCDSHFVPGNYAVSPSLQSAFHG